MPADKRSVSYHFGATESVTPVAKKVNDALRRSREEAAKGGLHAGIKGINDQAKALGLEGRDSLQDFIRGGGAAGIAVLVGQALQGLPEAAKKFREALKTGATKVETSAELLAETLPVVGELAKGLRSLRSVLGIPSLEESDAKGSGLMRLGMNALVPATGFLPKPSGSEKIPTDKDLEQKAKEEAGKALKEARDEHRKEISKGLDENARRDIDAAFLAPLEGLRRAGKAARQEFQNTLKEIDADASKVGALGPEQQEEARAKLAQRRSAARIKLREEEARIGREGEQKITQAQAAAQAAELVTLGRTFEAEALLRKAAVNQQIEELKRTGTEEEIRFAKRKAHAEELAAIDRERIAQREKQFSFADMGIEFLEKEVELGGGALRNDVERLKINEAFARKRAEIDDLLAKENIDAKQRELLKGIRGGLDAQEQAALLNINRPRFSGGLAPGGEDRFGTGVVAAGRENDPANKIAQNTANMAKILELIKKQLEADSRGGSRGGGGGPPGSVFLPPLP